MSEALLSSKQENPAWPDDDEYSLSATDFQCIQSRLPENVLLLAAPVRNRMSEIDAAERELVQLAVASRQAEFSTGRVLASRALEQIGQPARRILQGSKNEPLWPSGVVGSITHTKTMCLVAVATEPAMTGLGIDLEANRSEFDGLDHLILRPDERQVGNRAQPSGRNHTRLVFSAKESLYKAIFPAINRFVDFQEVRLGFLPDSGEFTAVAPDDPVLDAFIKAGSGRYLRVGENLFTLWFQHSETLQTG